MAKNIYPDWKDYEKQIYSLLFEEFPDAGLVLNEHITGVHSKTKRQIDICIYATKRKRAHLGIVECKYLKRKVTVQTIDALIGMMQDVQASFALIYTEVGITTGAKQRMSNMDIECRIVPFNFLKDFQFVSSNYLPDIFMQEVEYLTYYCEKCDITNLYEIKIVRGFGETESIICPKCKTAHFENRTDGGYRVIKRFAGNIVSPEELDNCIVDHLLLTQPTWDKKYSMFFMKSVDERLLCKICNKMFDFDNLGSRPTEYGDHIICIECLQSNRTLLIDHGRIPAI